MTGRHPLVALAAGQGLAAMATALDDPTLVRDLLPSRPDPRLLEPPARAPLRALGQMMRRGVDPPVLVQFLPWLVRRPLELGLCAWDALVGALLPREDHCLLSLLRGAALRVRDVLPAAGERGVDTRRRGSAELVARLAAPSFAGASTDRLLAGLAAHELGAYEVLRQRGGKWCELLHRSKVLEATRSFAQLLSLAHLPTLASFYLDYLWSAFGYLPALGDLCEVLLDAGATERLPAAPPLGRDPQELREYMTYRAAIANGDPASAYGLFMAAQDLGLSRLGDGTPAGRHPRLALVVADLTSRMGESEVALADVNAIVAASPGWRYAARVRAQVAAATGEGSAPLEALDGHLHLYGNDTSLWTGMFDCAAADAPFGGELLGRLGREAACLPHDRAAWSALALFAGGCRRDAAEEIDARLCAQSHGLGGAPAQARAGMA